MQLHGGHLSAKLAVFHKIVQNFTIFPYICAFAQYVCDFEHISNYYLFIQPL